MEEHFCQSRAHPSPSHLVNQKYKKNPLTLIVLYFSYSLTEENE